MKRIALAAAFSLAATGAFAGSYEGPVMEPEVIAEETSSAGSGILLPVLAIILIAAAVAAAD